MCPWVSEITRATARGQGSWQPPCQGIHGKIKSLTATLLPPVDRGHWGLWDICGLKKRCLGLDLQVCWSVLAAPLRPLNTSTGQPWELSLAHKECSSKASTHTWLQHEWPLKGTGLLYATHMLANKPIKLGVSMCDKYCHQHVHDHKPAQPVPHLNHHPKLHCSITSEPQAALTVTIWLQLKHHF